MDRRGFLLACLAAGLAACGRSSGGSAQPAQPATASAAPTAAPVEVASTTAPPGTASAPTTVAEAAGLHTVPWSPDRSAYPAPEPFAHGVASGEPETGAVTIWTQLTEQAAGPEVTWQVAPAADFGQVAASGTATALQGSGAVKVRVEGLAPGQTWFYRFEAHGAVSPTGRTLTLPPADRAVAEAALALASCQHYEEGWFTALGDLADAGPDLVVFVGDFVYSRRPAASAVRALGDGGPQPQSLEQWRRRYDAYLRDPHLQRARAVAPWLVTWDDNERRGPLEPAVQAWWEHQPVGGPLRTGGAADLRRLVDLGALARLVLVDTRSHRDPAVCDRIERLGVAERCPELDDPARTMLGPEQEAWAGEALAGSTATWNLVAQQVVMTDLSVSALGVSAVNDDQWDGYPAARQRLLHATTAAPNPVVLSGDLHCGGLGILRSGQGQAVGVEVIAPSVSSVVPAAVAVGLDLAAAGQPDLVHFDPAARGWVGIALTATEMLVSFRQVDALDPEAAPVDGPAFRVPAGTPEPSPV